MSVPARETFPLLPEATPLYMYLVLVPFTLILLYGLYRRFRPYGLRRILNALLEDPKEKLRYLTGYVFGQRKVLETRFGGLMHAGLFFGALILFIGTSLVFIDYDILRFADLQMLRGPFYLLFEFSLDSFGLIFIAGTLLALYRRSVFQPSFLPNEREYTATLLGLLFLGVTGYVLEGLRLWMNPVEWSSWSYVGNSLALLLQGSGISLEVAAAGYQALWWTHAIVTFSMVAAIPYTNLFHVVSSSLYTLISPFREGPTGRMTKPLDIQDLDDAADVTLGTHTVEDLDWKQSLGLDACTNCGRCESACPATAAGTPLSPRKVVQDLREEMRRFHREGDANDIVDDEVVTQDEAWACTACGACVEACPVMISPLDYILEVRRKLTFEGELDEPKSKLLMNLTNSQNPYGRSPQEREKLVDELDLPTLEDNPDPEYVYWIGCAATYDQRLRKVAEAMAYILEEAGVDFAVLGKEEACNGDPARRAGEEGLYQTLAYQNLATFRDNGVEKVITHCPHCFNTFANEYPDFGDPPEAVHHAEFIQTLIEEGRLDLDREVVQRVTLHDSCYIGRFNDVFDEPRRVLREVEGTDLVEMGRNREDSFCCGAGGDNYWYEVEQEDRISEQRAREALETGADTLAVECPFCLGMLEDASKAVSDGEMQTQDVAELVANALRTAQ